MKIRENVEEKFQYGKLNPEEQAKFLENVDGDMFSNDSCALWTGYRGTRPGQKHGSFTFKNKRVRAHVLAYHNCVAPLPDNYGMSNGNVACVLHKCMSEGRCVNVNHLYIGSARQNAIDKVIRDKTWTTKLSEEQIVEIRTRAFNGESRANLSREFDLSLGYVSSLCIGKAGIHAGGPLSRKQKQRRGKRKAAFTIEEVEEIRRRKHEESVPNFELAQNTDQKRQNISNIVENRAYRVDPATTKFVGVETRRLTPSQVVELRKLVASRKHSFKDLAPRFNITPSMVGVIARGETYADCSGPITKIGPNVGELSETQVIEIRNAVASKESQTSVGNRHGISQTMVGMIARGVCYASIPGPRTFSRKKKKDKKKRLTYFEFLDKPA